MAVTQNLKGTSYPSFKIHKSGPTLYQGSVAPTQSAVNGDLFLQHGSDGALWIYDNGSWGQVGASGTSTDTNIIINSSNSGSQVQQFVLFGETSDGNEHILAPTSAFSIDTTSTTIDSILTTLDTGSTSGVIGIPANSAGMFEVRIVARDAANNNNAGYKCTGVIVNDNGTTTLLADPTESIIGESNSEWYAVCESQDNGNDSLIIKVSGSANTTVRWTAFVTLTLVNHVTPTYALSASSNSIDEGGTVDITLTTTSLADGMTAAYTVTGVDANDLSAGNLTGVFTINSNSATASFTLAEDVTTEGAETLTLALDNGLASIDVVVNDTSGTPTYTLSADNTTINEGDTVTFTLTTTNVADSTTVAYTVTGVDADDLSAGSLTGNFTISGGTGTAVFTLAEDTTTEGQEVMTLTLDNGGDALDVVITDTSLNAPSTPEGYSPPLTLTPTSNGGTTGVFIGEDDHSVATNNNYAIVTESMSSAYDGSTYVKWAGWCYLFDMNTGDVVKSWNPLFDGDHNDDGSLAAWTPGGTFTQSSKYHTAQCGRSTAINSNYAFVSAVFSGYTQSAGAYVFAYSLSDYSIAKVFRLADIPNVLPDDGNGASANTDFGYYSMRATENWLVVPATRVSTPGGATNDPATSEQEGAIFIYDISDANPANWSLAKHIENPVPDSARSVGPAGWWGSFGQISHISESGNFMYVNKGGRSYKYNLTNGTWDSNPVTMWSADPHSNTNYNPTDLDDVYGDADHSKLEGNILYWADRNGDVVKAYDLSTETLLWTSATYDLPRSIDLSDDHVYVQARDGTEFKIYVLNKSDGTLAKTFTSPNQGTGAGSFGQHFGVTNDGKLIASEQDPNNDFSYMLLFKPSASGGSTIDQLTVSPNYTMSDLYANLGIGSTTFTWGDNGNTFMVSLIYGSTGYYYYRFELTTPYDLSTATYADTASQGWVGHGESVGFSNDGMKFYIERQGAILQYDLSTAYTVGSYSGSNNAASLGTILATGSAYADWFWNSDGTKIYVADSTARTFKEYTLASAWELSTASHTATYDFSTDIPSGTIKGMVGVSDLSKFYVLANTRIIYEFAMSSAGDITTTSLTASLDITNDISDPNCMDIKHDDTVLYIMGSGSELYTITLGQSSGSGSGGGSTWYGDRALIIGGNNRETTMDYYNITTTGNATDFGDTVENTIHSTAISDGSRTVFTTANTVNKYETVSISTAGNSTTFGDLYRNGHSQNSCTDGSRGVFAGGSGPVDTMEYITIGTTGTASDWGYVLSQGRGYGGGTSDGTKGFYFGGSLSGTPRSSNVIDYITIQVPSDATDFGDLSQGLQIRGATADATRAVVGGGMTTTNNVYSNEIQYITMASVGNATDFGDLTRNAGASCTGDGTYATWSGGVEGTGTPTYYTNVIDRVTIQTTGNATDFGDLSVSGNGHAATSGNSS